MNDDETPRPGQRDEDAEAASAALRVLDRRTPAAVGWRPADVVRRTAGVRRRSRLITGGAAVLVAAVATTVAVVANGGSSGPGGSPAGPPLGAPLARVAGVHEGARIGAAVQLVADASPLVRPTPTDTAAVLAAEQRLSIALLRQVGDGTANVSVSPDSLYLALAMLQNGARGQTATQIATALQASGLSSGEQNAGLAALTDELGAAAKSAGITLQSANSIWAQRGFPVGKQFLADLAAYYQAGVWQVDFRTPAAVSAINSWTSDNTHGKITKLFDRLDPSTVMVLANALYFHASWQEPFDPAKTEPGTFTTGSGRRVQTKFMDGVGLKGVTTAAYQAAQLPYQGGRFAALAVMPASGSIAHFVAGLTPSSLSSIAAAVQPGAEVRLPRFTTTSTTDLVPVLRGLGMRDAFTDGADFSGLSSQPTFVGPAIQRVYLGVGEKGTTAAAVTGFGMEAAGAVANPPTPIVFDHPFLFLIRDTRTGAVLFATELQDPTA